MISGTQTVGNRRSRGTHSTRVKNPNPEYIVPDSHNERGRPAFIREIVGKSQSRDVTLSDEAILSRSWGDRQKRFYKDRANAINALHAVFCEHVNLATHQVEISLRNASDAAGLSTISAAERKKAEMDNTYTPRVSISRASRALRDMVELGWLVADKKWQVWDKEVGQWLDKYFEATPLFFNAIGVTTERVEKLRNQRMGLYQQEMLKAGYSLEEVGRMSPTRLKEERRQLWRKKAFERRQLETARKRVQRQMTDKSREKQRTVAQRRVLESLGSDSRFITPAEFKTLVNKELAMLRKFSGVSAPPH